ncbi:hypothetical protein WN944_016262 [Citrus x changshan-huyou]|uniref:Uncharacterized protein n=1 Tax=Citrus x changshan-huyou TaxID=2935761 RepID=A0AAP0M916_9ROSI
MYYVVNKFCEFVLIKHGENFFIRMYSVVNKYKSNMYFVIRTQTEDPIGSVYKTIMSISVWEYFKPISLDWFDNMSQIDPNRICPPLSQTEETPIVGGNINPRRPQVHPLSASDLPSTAFNKT